VEKANAAANLETAALSNIILEREARKAEAWRGANCGSRPHLLAQRHAGI
jgi:hypothetical protein